MNLLDYLAARFTADHELRLADFVELANANIKDVMLREKYIQAVQGARKRQDATATKGENDEYS